MFYAFYAAREINYLPLLLLLIAIVHQIWDEMHRTQCRRNGGTKEGQGAVPPLTAACVPHIGLLKVLFLEHHVTVRQQTMMVKVIITFNITFSAPNFIDSTVQI